MPALRLSDPSRPSPAGTVAGAACHAAAGAAPLDHFAQSFAHEVRAPIDAIAGFAKALERELAAPDPRRALHYVQRIRAGAQQLEQYVEALLTLAHAAGAPALMRPTDLSGMARAVLADLQLRDSGRRVACHVEDGLQGVGDPRLLRMVLENLLGNAWKFTSRRAAATISFAACRTAEGQLAYRVSDNGAGFDTACAPRLFQDFQRLHSQSEFPGTGLGLATVRRIVERHGGRAWAESVPGEGASFFFMLAGAPATRVAAPAKARVGSLPARPNRTSRFKDAMRA